MGSQRNLEVTYRKGRPVAAYLYLARQPGDVSARVERSDGGLLVDYSADGRPIGVEITSPRRATLTAINAALASAQQPLVTADDVAPLIGMAGTAAD